MNITLQRYWELLVVYLRPLKKQVTVLAVLLLGSIALQIINPQIIRYFIDAALEGSDADQNLVGAALVFLGFAVIQQLTAVGAAYVGENVAWTATNALRRDLALHCLNLDMTFHNVTTPGELVERIDLDVAALANFFSQFTIRVFGNLILMIGILAVMFLEDWRIGIVFALFTWFSLVVMNKLRSAAAPHWRDARAASAELYGFLEERLAGTEDIRASGANAYVSHRFSEEMDWRVTRWNKARWMNFRVVFVIRALASINLMLAFVLGYLLFDAGTITLGVAYVIVYYTNVLMRPLNELTNQFQDLQRAAGSIIRIEELYNTKATILDGTRATLPDGALRVEFDHVTFKYSAANSAETALQDVHFILEPGKILGLLGRTGAGKSTMARLLFRLYDVEGHSAVRLHGIDVRDVKLEDLRQRVGMVTQDVQLFRASIRDNITFFDKRINDDQIMAVLKELGLLEWIQRFPRGLDTELEYGGKGLSAGEGQLLAFTRVFLRNPGLIILDEASSRLDPVTEHLIERAVDKLLRGRTGIIIAHRLATVQRADEIMILENGQIREYGNRLALLADPASRFAALLRAGGLEELLK